MDLAWTRVAHVNPRHAHIPGVDIKMSQVDGGRGELQAGHPRLPQKLPALVQMIVMKLNILGVMIDAIGV